MIDILHTIGRHLQVPDRREVWEWAGGSKPDRSDAAVNFGNTTSFRGVYDVNNVPWTREFLKACKDAYVREVTFIAPPQDSGKTKAAETYMAYRVCTAPTNIAFNTSTNVKAEQWSETRWEPMLTATPRIAEKFAANKHLKKKRRIIFSDGTFLLIQGAETEGNRASDSVEVHINDEVYVWDRPWLKEMHDRTGAYRDTRKIINVSVAGTKGSELHERFLAGNQLEWQHVCPGCRGLIPYVFNARDPRCNIRFDINAAIMHADGRLDLREFMKTVLVNCPDPKCGRKFGYDRERLAEMNRGGIYIPQNPDADPSIVSLHVNSFALGREPWHEILAPWVKMNIRGGLFTREVLKEFITKKLAEFWDDKPEPVTREVKLSDWTRASVIRPKSWADEVYRVMTVDNQRGERGDIPHRWFACIAFAKDGRMRIVDAGRINEWSALKQKQVELGIPEPTEAAPGPWVLVDRRHNPVEVDEMCAKFKWYGMMGSDQAEFVHPPYSPFAGTRQLFSEDRYIDIGFGTSAMGRTYAIYYLWSTQRIQDLTAQLRNGGMIEFAKDVNGWCPELATHVNSHHQVMERDKNGEEKRTWKRIGDTPDHIWDCICEAVVSGCMAGIYRKETT
jgi:hypothetical protein